MHMDIFGWVGNMLKISFVGMLTIGSWGFEVTSGGMPRTKTRRRLVNES